MNQTQKEKLLAVVEKDAKIRLKYIDEHGDMCFIGGLLDEIGYKVQSNWGGTAINRMPRISRKLEEAYGLSSDEVRMLQRLNDNNISRCARQNKLRAYINALGVDKPENFC